MKVRFPVTLRDIECEVEANMLAAEPDIGIMSAYLEEIDIIAPKEAKTWELTDEEIQKIVDAGDDWYYDDHSEDFDTYEGD
jgi:hypothetical protein